MERQNGYDVSCRAGLRRTVAFAFAVSALVTHQPAAATASSGNDARPPHTERLRRHVLFVNSDDVASLRAASERRDGERATPARRVVSDEAPPPAYGTPPSSSSPCQKGQIEFDARYIYTCVATNAWTRTITSSF